MSCQVLQVPGQLMNEDSPYPEGPFHVKLGIWVFRLAPYGTAYPGSRGLLPSRSTSLRGFPALYLFPPRVKAILAPDKDKGR